MRCAFASRHRRSPLHAWAIAGTLVICAGCSASAAYQRPQVATPGAWRDTTDTQSSTWPSQDWWHAFGSPQLDTLIHAAQRDNFDLAAAAARMRQADAQVSIAGAALLPSLSLGSEASRERQPRSRAGSGNGSTATIQQVAFSASYEIDFWGKNRAARDFADAGSRASRYDRDTLELSIAGDVATTYFEALALHDRLDAATRNLSNARSILGILHGRLAAGLVSSLDVAQQETVVATLSATIAPLQAQLRHNVDALAILLGQLPESVDVAAGSIADLAIPAVTPGVPSELLARRPDIAAAEANLAGANADIRAARAAFFPSLQLTAQGGLESAALASTLGPSSTLFTFAAGLVQPIFEGGRLEGQYRVSRGRYDELLQDYRKAVVAAFGDVEDALASTRATAEQEEQQQQATAAARRAYEIATARLRAGSVDTLTVLTAQNAVFSSEDALVQVRLARLQATVGLFKALGGGWELTGNTHS